MEADLKHHLISCAAEFGRARGMKTVTVSRLSTGDWRFFERLDGGASFTARKYDAIMLWFSANWPADALWPHAVPRPEIAPPAVHAQTLRQADPSVIRNPQPSNPELRP